MAKANSNVVFSGFSSYNGVVMFTQAVNFAVAVLLTFLPVSSPCTMSASIVCSCHAQEIEGTDGDIEKSGHACCHGHSQDKGDESENQENDRDDAPTCPNCDHELIKSLKSTTPNSFHGVVAEDLFAPVFLLVPMPQLAHVHEVSTPSSLDRPLSQFQIPPPMSLMVARVHRLLI